jgi:hypothetical protein
MDKRNWQHVVHRTKKNKAKTQHNMCWTPPSKYYSLIVIGGSTISSIIPDSRVLDTANVDQVTRERLISFFCNFGFSSPIKMVTVDI